MSKFVKKTVVIEAEQWLGKQEQKERLVADGVIMEIPSQDGSCLVPTLEGNLTCMVNDWIVTDDKGQKTVCSSDVFESTYDLVEEVEEEVVLENVPVAKKSEEKK